MSLLNLLSAVTGMAQPQQAQTPSVDELSVTGARPQPRFNPQMQAPPADPGPLQGAPQAGPMDPPDPGTPQTQQPPGINYNNTGAVNAVHSALQDEGPPQGGSTNPGVYGLLPQHLQHGTLRNILGALGDAFLVGHGDQAQYRPRMERQEVGNAMAGMDINDPQSVQAAVQRVAATGAPGAAEMADKLQQQAEQAQLRRQYMEYNQQYRQQVMDDRHTRTDAQQAQVADRYRPQVGGMLSGVKDAATYATKYHSLEAIARQIGGADATPASLWSIPEPGNWTPELTASYGMTSNNQQQSADRASNRANNIDVAHIRAGATTTAAGINAGGHIAAAGVSNQRPSEANFMNDYAARRKAGGTTSAEEDARFAHDTQVSRGRRPSPGGSASGPVVTNGDVTFLRNNDNPTNRARFESHFGAGSARKYLGH